MTFWTTCGAAAAVLALLAGSAGAQEFRYRGWAGDRVPGDKDNGCVMAMELRGGVGGGFVLYGNSKRAFRIGVGGRELELAPGKETFAAVAFDDGPPIVLKGTAQSKTLVLFEPLDFEIPGGLARLVEGSRTVRMTFGKRYLRARLSGSSKALELLARCASAPPEEKRTAAAAAAGQPQPEGGRAAEFGFLRQGTAVTEAHEKLLGAGWQADDSADPPASGVPDEKLAALRAKGLPVRSCDEAAKTCVIDYADAFGNDLRVTVATEGDPRLKSWRLNPPDAPAERAPDPADEEVPADR